MLKKALSILLIFMLAVLLLPEANTLAQAAIAEEVTAGLTFSGSGIT